MKDMRAVRFNEKVKRVSTVLGGVGIALIVTALARSTDHAPDLSTGLWILIGAMLMFASVQINDLLDSEDAE